MLVPIVLTAGTFSGRAGRGSSKGLSNFVSESFFFYPTLPSFATFVLAVRWIFYAGPPPDTVQHDLIWLLPFEASLVYNTIALIFLNFQVACVLNLALVLGYPIWSSIKAGTGALQPLIKPLGVYSWYIFTMCTLGTLFLYFGIMALVLWGSGVFRDLKKYKKGGAMYLATTQTFEKVTGSENGRKM